MKRTVKAKDIIFNTAKEYKDTQYDPIMQQLILIIKHSSLTVTAIANKSGVSEQCIHNWLSGRTRRPQALTMKFVLRVLGYELKIIPSAGHNRGPSLDDEAA